MNRDDQQYILMMAAAAAADAKKKARDEARRALIISTALNQNMSSPLDPNLQELLRAETRRVKQENFEWKLGWWALGIFLGGYGLFALFVIFAGSCHSTSYANAGRTQYTATATPKPTPVDMTRLDRVWIGTKVKWYPPNGSSIRGNPFVGEVTAKDDDSISMSWGGVFRPETLADHLNTGEAEIIR
jgi:hypothetical protein